MERSDTIRKHKQQHKPNYYPSGIQRMDKELLVENQLNSVDAVENTDYTKVSFKDTLSKTGQTKTDCIITVDIAKEICMIVGASPRTNAETKALSKKFTELKLYISLGYSVEQACQRFTVSQAMVEYAIKYGQEFNNLYKEDYKHEKK